MVQRKHSEIDFEEEPGSSLISTKQNNEERYQEHELSFAETIEEEETLRLEQKKSK
jgi:hypothetical protein